MQSDETVSKAASSSGGEKLIGMRGIIWLQLLAEAEMKLSCKNKCLG